MLMGFGILGNVLLFPILKSERKKRNLPDVVMSVELVESKI